MLSILKLPSGCIRQRSTISSLIVACVACTMHPVNARAGVSGLPVSNTYYTSSMNAQNTFRETAYVNNDYSGSTATSVEAMATFSACDDGRLAGAKPYTAHLELKDVTSGQSWKTTMQASWSEQVPTSWGVTCLLNVTLRTPKIQPVKGHTYTTRAWAVVDVENDGVGAKTTKVSSATWTKT